MIHACFGVYEYRPVSRESRQMETKAIETEAVLSSLKNHPGKICRGGLDDTRYCRKNLSLAHHYVVYKIHCLYGVIKSL